MQISAFDYARDRVHKGGSLAKIATLIKAARSEALRDGSACLLLDNGDTLQGSPLGDIFTGDAPLTEHPMTACMNLLEYDACGLGNHDFDHGLEHLARCLEQHRTPVLCSNLTSAALPMVRRSLLLARPVHPDRPDGDTLQVGLLATVPSKTALWNRYHLQGRVDLAPPLPVLAREAADLRARGADLVIVLAHMGLALADEGEDGQNQVREVAALADVDVVIGGHTHLRFPGPDHAGLPDIDCEQGLVLGKPMVQPGTAGSDLGVIDLSLQRTGQTRWSIVSGTVALRPATRETCEDQSIIATAAKAHSETRRFLSQSVCQLKSPMNSFFTLAHPGPVPALLAAAKRREITRVVKGTPYEDLPLVSVASTPLTGGFDGPDNFLDLSAGHLHMRHVSGMNPYSNNVWAVRTTGAQLLDWLERSALIFNTLSRDDPDQMLVDPAVPGFRFDSIYGLTYMIDPRRPPLFDTAGKRVPEREGRILDARWNGHALRPEQEFLVATTDHRAGGGGVYKTFNNDDIVVQGHAPMQDVLLDYLKAPVSDDVRGARPWRFAPDLKRRAILLTAPEAIHYLEDIAHLRPEVCGETPGGFLRVRLHL